MYVSPTAREGQEEHYRTCDTAFVFPQVSTSAKSNLLSPVRRSMMISRTQLQPKLVTGLSSIDKSYKVPRLINYEAFIFDRYNFFPCPAMNHFHSSDITSHGHKSQGKINYFSLGLKITPSSNVDTVLASANGIHQASVSRQAMPAVDVLCTVH